RRESVETLARRFGLPVPLDVPVGALAAGVQQKVEILKALHRGVDVLILDEPTTMLTPQEVDGLFATLRSLAEGGVTVVFITHKIGEIVTNADRVTVMRRALVFRAWARAALPPSRLVEPMRGERAPAEALPAPRPAAMRGASVLAVKGLSVAADRPRVVDDCSLDVHAGEIVGVAGGARHRPAGLAAGGAGGRPAAGGGWVPGADARPAGGRGREP